MHTHTHTHTLAHPAALRVKSRLAVKYLQCEGEKDTLNDRATQKDHSPSGVKGLLGGFCAGGGLAGGFFDPVTK